MQSKEPMNSDQKRDEMRRAALEYHEHPIPGKISIAATKQMVNQHDLALAYSPGVAFPCEEIVKDPNNAFKYTSAWQLGSCYYQRHSGARLGRYWPFGLQAGDGRQRRFVQKVRGY